ncbi:hypothetical protein [Herbiconiux ginsengi]|uniref:Uncharacterized membrane protein n=1 Tax=Herbiconiux ginsengi TaxID=381665 RepID=A0A1H3TT23_9MICO|nr:hypothetical protein [Herbiconiux ginsengi]SDZ53187.1 Uncharacterized membrane protein [Herbiconiux ginsengi]
MIRRTTITAETAAGLDGSLLLSAVAGAAVVLVLGLLVLLVVRVARRREAAGRTRARAGADTGWSAGVARVPGDRDGAGRRAVARLFGRPSRSIGLDVARGAALAGLALVVWFGSADSGVAQASRLAAIAGVGQQGPKDALAFGGTVVALAFVLIAGVATALSSGGATPPQGVERLRCRMRLALRAIVLLGIGGVAAFSAAPFAGLVATIGALTLVALAVVGWRAGTLFLAAVLWTIVVPVLDAGLVSLVVDSRTLIAPALEWALAGAFPPVPLVGVLLAGMAVGRLDAVRIGRRLIVFAGAAGCAILAFAAGAAVSARFGASLPPLLSAVPGAMTPLALLGAGGVALALVALALIVGRPLRWVLVPFSAAGSMALTLWIASLAVIGGLWIFAPATASEGLESVPAALSGSGVVESLATALPEALRSTATAGALVVLVALACIVWRLFLGDGPVERLVKAIGAGATRVPDELRSPAEAEVPPVESTFDALMAGRDAATEATGTRAPGADAGVAPPDAHPLRRQTIGPVDPVTAATQWTPGQALGRLPY